MTRDKDPGPTKVVTAYPAPYHGLVWSGSGKGVSHDMLCTGCCPAAAGRVAPQPVQAQPQLPGRGHAPACAAALLPPAPPHYPPHALPVHVSGCARARNAAALCVPTTFVCVCGRVRMHQQRPGCYTCRPV